MNSITAKSTFMGAEETAEGVHFDSKFMFLKNISCLVKIKNNIKEVYQLDWPLISFTELKTPIQGYTHKLLLNQRLSETTIWVSNPERIRSIFSHSGAFQGFMSRYTKIRLLGKGNFGNVWLIRRNSDQKKFAAKFFDKNSLSTCRKKMLRSEVEILAKLEHPNVVELEELNETPFFFLIITEFIPGVTLEKIIGFGGLDEKLRR